MQSSKKSVTTTGSRCVTYSCSLNKNITKKKTAFTQTERYPSPFEEIFRLNQNVKADTVLNEEVKTVYSLALGYINNVHRLMNVKLCENYGDCGDANSEVKGVFKLPEIPNHAAIFPLLLEKSKATNLTPNRFQASKGPDFKCVKGSFSDYAPNAKKIVDLRNAQEGEKNGLAKSPREYSRKINEKNRGSDTVEEGVVLGKPRDIYVAHKRDENVSYVKQVEIYSHEERITEKETMMENKTEGDLLKLETEETKCDPYKEAPNQVEDVKRDDNNTLEDINVFDQRSIADLIKKRVQEEFISYMSKTNEKQAKLVSSNHHVVNIQPQINLLEYAQKKLERQVTEEMHPGESPPDMTLIHPSNRVSDMFQRISQEHLGSAASRCDWRNGYGSHYDQSDSDSVIFDDEEFEKMNRTYCRQETVEHCRVNQEISHPLKLTGKDKPKLNEKMLNTIGLFTERGDIRPGILDIMEKEKQAKASDSRNKQFRVKRQWDFQHSLGSRHCANKSLTSLCTNPNL